MTKGLKKRQRKLRLALYVRVSHEEQAKHGYSLDAQKETLKEWVKENGHIISGWYIDEGVSARKKVKHRPEMQRMLKDAQTGIYDMIIFIKLDRYFRSVSEYHATQTILEDHGVHWKAILEDYDTTTTEGRFKINIMLSIAEQEADATSDRIRFTNEHKIKKGQPITGHQPRGYKIGEKADGSKCVIKDETAAPYITAIFEHFLKYQSIAGVVKHMVLDLGYSISTQTTKRVLKNTYYYGHYRGNDNYCPAYIDKATFDKIQEILKEKNIKRSPTQNIYLFSGLLRCPECGSNLASYQNGKSGKHFSYYCQRTYQQRTCTFNKTFAESKLEKWLIKELRPRLEKYIAEIEISPEKIKPQINISEIRGEMERLNFMFEKNRISENEYDKKYIALENKIEEAKKSENKSVDLSKIKAILDSDLLDIYEGLPKEERRAALRSIIDKIAISADWQHEIIFLK